MAIKRLRGVGSIGVVSDLVDADLPPNAWTDALNVRFTGTKVENIGGWKNAGKTFALGDQTPYEISSTDFQIGQYFLASDKYIYSTLFNKNFDPSDPNSPPELRYNVTPLNDSGVDYPSYDTPPVAGKTKINNYSVDVSKRWNSTIIAQRVVFNTPLYNPICQKDGEVFDQPLIELPNWGVPSKPTGSADPVKVDWKANLIKTYKDYLFALNMKENNIQIPNRVRWSDVAFENQVPTNWYEDDPNTDGGWVDLMDATAPIVDGAVLRDFFMVYTNNETYVMQYVGGDAVFNNIKLFSDSGILSQGCVAEYEGQHFVVTKNDVIIHDGSQKKSIVDGIIKDRLIEEINSVNGEACRVFSNPVRKEAWVCYPYSKDGSRDLTNFKLNRAAVYNFQHNTWTFMELPNLYSLAFVDYRDITSLANWEQGNEFLPTNKAWDDEIPQWDDEAFIHGTKQLAGCSADHCVYILDSGDFQEKVTFLSPTTYQTSVKEIPRYVHRDYIDFDEDVNYPMVKTLRTIYPQSGGIGNYNFTIGSASTVGGTIKSKPAIQFQSGIDYKVDTFVTGRFISYHIETSGKAAWNLGGVDFDFVVEGQR